MVSTRRRLRVGQSADFYATVCNHGLMGNRHRAAVLAVLLVATAGVAVGAAPVSVLDGTPRVLEAGTGTTTGVGTATPSVGDAVAADTAALDSRFDTLVTAERLAAAGTERPQVVRTELEATGDRLDDLQAAQQRAYRGHANGTLSERETLARLARVQAAAGPLGVAIDDVQRSIGDDPPVGVSGRLATLAAERRALRGPVRGSVLDALRGESPPARVFVRSADTGVVAATLEGDSYYREAFRADHIDADPRSSFGGTLDIIGHTLELYPWVASSNSGVRVPQQFADGGVRPVIVSHTQGELTAFLDGSTREVFREVHRLDAGQMPTREPVRGTDGTTTVAVNHTYAGGPMVVTVTVDGTPAGSVPVSVDGERVGETDPDGRLRALAPAEAFAVSAGGANVTVPALDEG